MQVTNAKHRTTSGKLPVTTPIWLAPCPKCADGTIRAEHGQSVNWVYVCSHCGSAFELLAEGYQVARWRLVEGPHACPQIPWRGSRPRPNLPPASVPSPAEFKKYRRFLRRHREVREWLNERGLNDDTITHWRWGYGQPDPSRPPGLIIPIPRYRPVTYRIRYWPEPWVPPGVESGAVKIATPRGHPQHLWPHVPHGRGTLLTEGELRRGAVHSARPTRHRYARNDGQARASCQAGSLGRGRSGLLRRR